MYEGKDRSKSTYNVFSDEKRQSGSYNAYSTEMRNPRISKKRGMKPGVMFATDVLLLGVSLVIFALFHHVIKFEKSNSGAELPTPTPATTEIQQTPTSPGDFSVKWASKFISGEPQITDSGYVSENINVQITKKNYEGAVCYVADIYVRDIKYFKTAFAGGVFSKSIRKATVTMASENHAIAAISGDSFGFLQTGIVVRNGVLYQDTFYSDICVLNYDGTMETFYTDDFDLAALKEKGAWQVWSFGPMLLENGEVMTKFNNRVNPRNPRSAVGYYEPGHYCFIVVDGRQPGYSDGLTTSQISQLFHDMGCKVAYNLDGGQTATMAFRNKEINIPYSGGRGTSDILMIADE